jgi:ribonuclease HI
MDDKKIKKITAFADGSCKLKIGLGGIGVYIPKYNIKYTESFHRSKGIRITNQTMELYSCIRAMQLIIEKGGRYDLTIYSDSLYVVNIANEFGKRWIQRGWPNKVKNVELVKEFYTLAKLYSVTFIHMPTNTPMPPKDSKEYLIWYGIYRADKLSKLYEDDTEDPDGDEN